MLSFWIFSILLWFRRCFVVHSNNRLHFKVFLLYTELVKVSFLLVWNRCKNRYVDCKREYIVFDPDYLQIKKIKNWVITCMFIRHKTIIYQCCYIFSSYVFSDSFFFCHRKCFVNFSPHYMFQKGDRLCLIQLFR